jgi:hypothetical protein
LPTEFTPEEQAECDGWEELGDEVWAVIDWGEGEDVSANAIVFSRGAAAIVSQG